MPENFEQAIEQALDQHLRQKAEEMVQELSGQLKSACGRAVAEAVEAERTVSDANVAEAAVQARLELAAAVAESVRAIRSEDSVTSIAAALVDGAARFCGRSVLFIHRADQLLGFRAAGRVSPEVQEAFQRLATPVGHAPAVAEAITAFRALETEGGEARLSPEVARLLELGDGARVHLFPVALRDKVLAVLGCDAGPLEDGVVPAPVIGSAIETLVAVAEAWIEAVGTRRKQTAA
jgi:hypothetical protein